MAADYKENEVSELDKPIFRGHSRRELERAFDLVKPNGHWKNPIDAKLPRGTTIETLTLVEDSIDFYCGGNVRVWVSPDGSHVVKAPGYYNQIGA